ncbi:sulfotransferase [Halioglobus sp.]|nr:sulfotransferase [Halioglobus sp.]
MADLFIIAQHRTGSTLLKNMLDAHPAIIMAFDEMNLFEPLRNNTLDRLIYKGVDTPDGVVDAIYAGQVYGTFWKRFSESGIDRKALLEAFGKKTSLAADDVLRQILRLQKERGGVNHSGAKYPVHVARLDWLLQHFPRSRVLFLFRNPLDVVASKVNDEATRTRKQKSLIYQFGIHYFTLFYFCLEFRRACRVYQMHRGDVLMVQYESLVRAPEEVLRGICEYLGVCFHPAMLFATGKNSSYTGHAFGAPVSDSIDRYQDRLSKFDQWLIRLFTQKLYKALM